VLKMDMVIYINCDNSAFCDAPHQEVSRILIELGENIEKNENIKKCKLRDINGNEVGYVNIAEY